MMSLNNSGSSFAASCIRNLLAMIQLVLIIQHYKATTVTHTKRIDCNLLRKETSFMCYTFSVLRKSQHMKQKKKLHTVE